jgi:hypothetical protein
MERVPRARVQNREMARANAIPKTETVHPRVKVAKGKAGELAKGPAAVRVEDRERDKAVGGNLRWAAVSGGYKMLQSLRGGPFATP